MRTSFLVSLITVLLTGIASAKTPTFVCKEPGGKRLIMVDESDVGPVDAKWQLRIDSDGYINDRDGKHVLWVSDDDVRHDPTGVRLATFDGENLRHGKGGKIILNYHEKEICPDPQSNRIYSIEGEESLSKAQLVAAMYLLNPDLFKLTKAEEDEQKQAIAEAAAEQEKIDNADPYPGQWAVLNSSGIMEKLSQGTLMIGDKKGDAYSVTIDLTKGGGPSWTGVGVAVKTKGGDKNFFLAYGTPKTVGLCVYQIEGGTLKGKWQPWYVDGDPKNTGSETLQGPTTLDGEYKITSAASPTTGASYTGTVAIHPMKIVGTADNAKPYSLVWTIGTAKLSGIAIKSDNCLYVVCGTGADSCIAKYQFDNGSMSCDWFKLGSNEGGHGAITKVN